jgi:hypothetical protein
MQREANGRGEKIALPSARVLTAPEESAPAGDGAAAEDFVEDEDVPAERVPDEPVPEVVAAGAVIAEETVPEPALPLLEPATAPAAAPAESSEPERQFTARWQFEPPDADLEDDAPADVPAPGAEDDEHEPFATAEPAPQHDVEPPVTTRSFDAALESLQRRMERAKLSTDFVRSLLVVDTVIDVGEAAMRWAGMPNKHERALTSEVFFALAEWGFLAPRADGRYRVLYGAEDDPAV